jgi:hypothetical protein
LAVHLVESIPVGVDNALQDLGVGRALGTTAPGPFGVGGPSLPAAATTSTTATVSASATESVAPKVHSAKADVPAATAGLQAADPETTPASGTAPPRAPRPKVRFPIDFNSHKRPKPSSSAPAGEQSPAGEQTTTGQQPSSGEPKKAA